MPPRSLSSRWWTQLDPDGYWQILVYAGRDSRLVRMADPDGRDWPDDPV